MNFDLALQFPLLRYREIFAVIGAPAPGPGGLSIKKENPRGVTTYKRLSPMDPINDKN